MSSNDMIQPDTLELTAPILLVDDLVTARKIIRKLLNELGYENIEEAENGEVAIHKLEAKPFSLVFMDWNMPKLNGIETVQKIRSHPTLAALPVIMVTANNTKEHVVEAAKSGASDYICKPFSVEILRKKISTVCAKLCQ